MGKPDNPSAFPSGDKAAFPTATFDPGMSLRDWFAGQALGAVLHVCGDDTKRLGETPEQMFARKAYALADAMLAERSK